MVVAEGKREMEKYTKDYKSKMAKMVKNTV
jgi:hypothetical protein